ncbi:MULTISPECIES: efflux RND transporter periplasmic adaptor subunit [Pseudoalteromonas]|uniref:Multidrug resistance efflux pump n=1 Tax=Pseudoalteromonas luteoviolacea (strain 2ta16) TaxID=1353533 RepID=V4HSY7_PSEL2|nr:MULTISPECIES: HlyD family efflux transporter periplasmic adaptor subunit [Pseudoalteromonas]ESP93920.1 hypothetical protein PL2TA16_02828 [Pseudoalteromonas luteoviolacea 2ta16]KZN31352.1 hypothetical protein N483_05890 [Pseudoalteromonas luteoviolacea NCIMB 1944]MCG7548600.1 HlyD family efflux transporter periplasmic adaptor subunit [Pseudoalteromonas sp. Of7M-16]
MDIKKEKKKKPKVSKPVIVAASLALIASAYMLTTKSGASVDGESMVTSKVEKGLFTVKVEGFGTLIPNDLRVLTTMTPATVKKIVQRPGAIVKPNDLLVVLDNPELHQQVQSAQKQMSQAQANLKQLELSQELAMLDEQSTLSRLSADIEAMEQQHEAEKQLVESGVVSRLNYIKNLSTLNKLKVQHDIQTTKIATLEKVHEQKIIISQQQMRQTEGELHIAQERVNRLEVRADSNGVIQRLSVEEGQSLTTGQEILMIGSSNSLMAMLQVPQSQAQYIEIGQNAVIDTYQDKINGTVNRIVPEVQNNTVTVEIALPNQLPKSARPQRSIDGHIVINEIENALFIEHPKDARAFQPAMLYALSNDGLNATKRNLMFGYSSGKYIQINSGAKENDEFIISDVPTQVKGKANFDIQ